MPSTAPHSVDLRATRCPASFVEMIGVLETAAPGASLEFLLSSATTLDVPRMLRESGHQVLAADNPDPATLRVLCRRGED